MYALHIGDVIPLCLDVLARIEPTDQRTNPHPVQAWPALARLSQQGSHVCLFDIGLSVMERCQFNCIPSMHGIPIPEYYYFPGAH